MYNFLFFTVVILCSLNSGFMLFDGMRALIVGDYLRPKTGEYAGQLGPWSKLVLAIGINPESVFMKLIFVLYGLTGIFISILFISGYTYGWNALLIYNLSVIWYVYMGSLSSVLQIALLLVLRYLF